MMAEVLERRKVRVVAGRTVKQKVVNNNENEGAFHFGAVKKSELFLKLCNSGIQIQADGRGRWKNYEKSEVFRAVYRHFLIKVANLKTAGYQPKRFISGQRQLKNVHITFKKLQTSEQFKRALAEGNFPEAVCIILLEFFTVAENNVFLNSLYTETSYDFIGEAIKRLLINLYKRLIDKDYLSEKELLQILGQVNGAVYANIWTNGRLNRKGLELARVLGVEIKGYEVFDEGYLKHNLLWGYENGQKIVCAGL